MSSEQWVSALAGGAVWWGCLSLAAMRQGARQRLARRMASLGEEGAAGGAAPGRRWAPTRTNLVRTAAALGLAANPGRLLLYIAVSMGVGAAGGASFLNSSLGAPLGALAGVAFWWRRLVFRRRARTLKLTEQLPQALHLMVAGLRAGQSLAPALTGAGSKVPAPLGPELVRRGRELERHKSLGQVLADMEAWLGIPESRALVLATGVVLETGANLPAVYEMIAGTAEARREAMRQVEAELASQSLSATVLTVLGVGTLVWARYLSGGGAFLAGTLAGRLTLLLSVALFAAGYVIMTRLAWAEG